LPGDRGEIREEAPRKNGQFLEGRGWPLSVGPWVKGGCAKREGGGGRGKRGAPKGDNVVLNSRERRDGHEIFVKKKVVTGTGGMAP